MQPDELWEFQEKITKASLVPAQAWLNEQMLTATCEGSVRQKLNRS